MSVETGNLSEEELGITNPEQDERQLEEERRQQALAALEKRGFIERTEDGQIIANLEQIDEYSSDPDNKRNISLASRFQHIYGKSGYSVMQRVFRDQPVISREDWQQGKREAKPLFYEPASDEAALDWQAIAESDFYLNPWKGTRIIEFPGLDKVNKIEATMALYLYHPRYGNGRRDPETGRMMVRDSQRGQHRPINSDYFLTNYHFAPSALPRSNHPQPFNASPQLFLSRVCPNLLERGVLKLEDFRRINESEEEKSPTSSRLEIKQGQVTVNSIRYYVGKNLPEGSYAQLLPDGTVFVVSGDKKIQSYFKTQPEARKKGDPMIALNTQKTGLQPFDRTKYLQQKEGESDEEYMARIEGLNDFELSPIRTKDMPETTKGKIKRIFRDNWSRLENKDYAQRVIADFEKLLEEDEESKFYFVLMNQEILGFLRTQQLENGHLYIGSLNINPRNNMANVNANIFGPTIDRLSRTRTLECTAYPRLPVIRQYFEHGFIVNSLKLDRKTNTQLFGFELDRERNRASHFTRGSREVLSHYQNNNFDLNQEIIVLKFNVNEDYDAMIGAVNTILSQKQHVLTDYVSLPEELGYKYLVFERPIETKQREQMAEAA